MRHLLAIVLLFGAGLAGQVYLFVHRPTSSPAVAEGFLTALGGLRAFASEAIWFRAERLQHEGRFVELAQLASTLTFLEPHTPEVWTYASWNLAYNISVMMPTEEDRWRWVQAGLRLLRDDALRFNPKEGALYRELAWFFEVKLEPLAKLDTAAPYYLKAWRQNVRDVAARGAWHELGMDRAKMDEIEKIYHVSDWTDPQCSALYWAHQGLPYAHGNDLIFIRNIITQAQIIYRRREKMREKEKENES